MEAARKCSQCGKQTRWQSVSQEFEREGRTVRISGIPAMVCPNCDVVYYPPGVADRVARATDALFALASDSHKSLVSAEA